MVHEMTTSLPPADVLERARTFFSERVPHVGSFPEKAGPTFVTFRGQGGEELTVAALVGEAGTHVRASSLLFDQPIGRFFSTLPRVEEDGA